MAKIFRKTHNPDALCAITHSLTLTEDLIESEKSVRSEQCNLLTIIS